MKCRRLKAAVIWLIVQGKPCLFLSLFLIGKLYSEMRVHKKASILFCHMEKPWKGSQELLPNVSFRIFDEYNGFCLLSLEETRQMWGEGRVGTV